MKISIDMPEGMRKIIDHSVEKGLYQSRSELIREAIRDYLESEGLVQTKPLTEETIQNIIAARDSDEYHDSEKVKEELGVA